MSTGPNQQSTLGITLVTAPGCHFCEDAHRALTELIHQGAQVQLEVIDASSPVGMGLLSTHRAAMSPLVLVDGGYFSAGRLPRRKLRALLDKPRTSPTEPAAPHG